MRKIFSLAITLLLIPFSGNVMATSCSEVEAQIATKIINNGVPEDNFDLFSIDNNADVPQGGKVVGHCDGGTKQIIYSKNATYNKIITSSNVEKSISEKSISADSDRNTSADSDQNTSTESATSPDSDSDNDRDNDRDHSKD